MARSNLPGRGAPLSQRLWIYTIAAAPLANRRTPNGVLLATTLRHLNNWYTPTAGNVSATCLKFVKHSTKCTTIGFREKRRDWSIVTVKALPDMSTNLDDRLPILVMLPDGVKGNGPMINMTILKQLGVKSAPAFRAYLRLAYLWDNAKKKNNGCRVYATRPRALRNDRGQVTDAKGNVLPRNNWNHPRAVVTGEEDNPAAKHVPVLTDLDMMHLFFDDNPTSKATTRKRLHDARRIAENMEDKGYIVIETGVKDLKTGGNGWRILEPRLENVTECRPPEKNTILGNA